MSKSFEEQIKTLYWYHPNLTRHLAECLLIQNAKEGSYLIRPSSNSGEFAISVRCQDSVNHFVISKKNEVFTFGLVEFRNFQELTYHFSEQPYIGVESGMISWLKYPYPNHVLEPSLYSTVKLHSQMKGRVSSFQSTISIGSKEGFLTKQGGSIKNWKVRWFVLRNNLLSYYRHQGDREPIRALDLKECTSIKRDFFIGKKYCFSLEFDWRTFYFVCDTENDMQDWINIIQWKLKHLKTGVK